MIRSLATYLILGLLGMSTVKSMDTMNTEESSALTPSEPVMVIPSGLDYLKGRIVSLQSTITKLEGELEKETNFILSKNLSNSIIPSRREELEHLKRVQQTPNVYLDSIVQHLYTILKVWKSDGSYHSNETSLLLNLCKAGANHPKIVGYAARLTPPLEGIKIIKKAMFPDSSDNSPYFESECRSMGTSFQCDFIAYFAENWNQRRTDADYESLIKNAPSWFLETDYVYDRIEILKAFWAIPTLDQASAADFSSVFIQNGTSFFLEGRRMSSDVMRSHLIQAVAKIPPLDRFIVKEFMSLIFQVKSARYIISIPMWDVYATLMIEYLSFLLPNYPGELRDKTVRDMKFIIKSNPITSAERYEDLFQLLREKRDDKEHEGDCVLF